MKRGQGVLVSVLLAVFILVSLSGLAAARTLQTKVPGIDRPVQCVYVDQGNGYVYAGTEGGAGVYRSADNGANWEEYGTNLGKNDVLALVKREGDILAGTWGEGVWRVASGGASWSRLGSFPSGYGYIRSLAVGSSYTYAAESRGQVWRLASGSSTWEEIANLPTYPNAYTKFLFVDSLGNLYAGVRYQGVYKYVGTTWQAMNSGLGSRDGLAMDYGPDNTLGVGTSNGLYRWATDHWEYLWGSGKQITALKRNPQDTDEVTVGTGSGEVWCCRGSVGLFNQIAIGITSGQQVWGLAFGISQPPRLFAGANNGLYHTDSLCPTPTPTSTNTPIPPLRLGLSNDPDASVSLTQGDIITYTIYYTNPGASTLGSVVITCSIPVSGVVGWDPVEWEETHETVYTWTVGTVVGWETGDDDFWVAVGSPPETIPAPPGAMLVVNSGAHATVSGTPVPPSDPVYNWIGTRARIYLPLVMKNHG